MKALTKELDSYWRRLLGRLQEQTETPLAPTSLRPETSLKEELGLSSLETVSLAMDIEDEFDITIEDAELDRLVTVGDLLGLIAKKAGSIPAPSADEQPA